MFNNVLSHSNASKVTVKLIEDAMKTYIVVEDNGIGLFKKIKNDLSLQDEHQSLLELAKGKFSSNPKEHSGEGIFFSCRACDLFLIHSGSLTYSLDRASDIGKFIETDKDLFEWTKEAQERGAGEILFTSMNHDGVKAGYANDALAALADQLSIPIIASGGAGCKEHFRDVFSQGKADAALAASVFHFGEIKIPELKSYLCGEGITIRG